MSVKREEGLMCRIGVGGKCAYLLDQEVEVLWDLGCEAYGWEKSLCQSCLSMRFCNGTNSEAFWGWLERALSWKGMCA